MRRRLTVAGAAVLAGATLVSGCSGQGSVEAAPAVATAKQFAAASGIGPQRACALLAPQTRQQLEQEHGPCASSLPDQHLPTGVELRSADVYGIDAVVYLRDDTIFLARFGDGWKVTAAGCQLQSAGRPYQCDVQGQ